MVSISGLDNAGKPRQVFADKIAALDDDGFVKEAQHRIWLSAYASNNHRSDFHWQADACYDEAKDRGKLELYEAAFGRACA